MSRFWPLWSFFVLGFGEMKEDMEGDSIHAAKALSVAVTLIDEGQ